MRTKATRREHPAGAAAGVDAGRRAGVYRGRRADRGDAGVDPAAEAVPERERSEEAVARGEARAGDAVDPRASSLDQSPYRQEKHGHVGASSSRCDLAPRSRNDDDLDDEPLDDELDDEDLDDDELDDDDDSTTRTISTTRMISMRIRTSWTWTTSTTTWTRFVRSRRDIRTATTIERRVLFEACIGECEAGVNRG